MSVPVSSKELRATRAAFGSAFLTTTASPRVKVVIVDPEVEDDGTLRFRGPGQGTLRNLAANPAVTVAFWPLEHHGHALLVDGVATVEGDEVRVQVEHAVLHRPATHADGPVVSDGCGEDCRPVSG